MWKDNFIVSLTNSYQIVIIFYKLQHNSLIFVWRPLYTLNFFQYICAGFVWRKLVNWGRATLFEYSIYHHRFFVNLNLIALYIDHTIFTSSLLDTMSHICFASIVFFKPTKTCQLDLTSLTWHIQICYDS